MKSHGDIIDTETRKVRILAERCNTCVFHPGNLMYLNEGALQDIVRHNLDAGALLTCHKTLPAIHGPDPAACNGFWTAYGLKTTAGIIAKFVIGIIWIRLSEESNEQHTQGKQEKRHHSKEQEEDQGVESSG